MDRQEKDADNVAKLESSECNTCNEMKNDAEFDRYENKQGKKGSYHAHCQVCEKKKKEALNAMRLCLVCNEMKSTKDFAKDMKQRYTDVCRECEQIKQKADDAATFRPCKACKENLSSKKSFRRNGGGHISQYCLKCEYPRCGVCGVQPKKPLTPADIDKLSKSGEPWYQRDDAVKTTTPLTSLHG